MNLENIKKSKLKSKDIEEYVMEIGEDEGGWYVITKGDNNPTADPWKIRYDWITRVTVMVIY